MADLTGAVALPPLDHAHFTAENVRPLHGSGDCLSPMYTRPLRCSDRLLGGSLFSPRCRCTRGQSYNHKDTNPMRGRRTMLSTKRFTRTAPVPKNAPTTEPITAAERRATFSSIAAERIRLRREISPPERPFISAPSKARLMAGR